MLLLVPPVGLEPTLLAELDFESSASTNSATGALAGRVPSRDFRVAATASSMAPRKVDLLSLDA